MDGGGNGYEEGVKCEGRMRMIGGEIILDARV